MKTKPTKMEEQEMKVATLEPAPAGAVASSFLEVLKRQLHPSPTNPRKDFPEPTIEEMKASVEKHGIIQPLIVRRWGEKDRGGEAAYEIVCGERRFRGASRVESLERIPLIVRELTDTQVREIQIIENLQREDVSPYDEAVGYAALLELRAEDGTALYSVDRIAEKIGKAVSYVRNRLKMQRTPKVLLEALRKGLVGTRICEMVGRIPHAEDRERCAKEVLQAQYHDRPMTQEEALEHIRENYMVPLKMAPFDPKSAELLPKAGSCEDCPFRTGNDPDLAEDLSVGSVGGVGGVKSGIHPQVCQNPKCYRDKCEAHLAWVRKAAPELVLSEAEAKAVFDDWGHVKHGSKLKKASDKPGYQDVGHWDTGKLKPWRDYAKKLEVPVKLAKNPKTGQVVELVDIAAVKEAEKLAAPEKPVFEVKKSSSGGSEDSYLKQERARKELEQEEVRVAFDRLSHHLVGQVGREELLEILKGAVDHQGIDVMIRWMNLKPGSPKKGSAVISNRAHKIEAIVEAVRADAEHFDREGILILILMAQFAEGCSYNGVGSSRFKEFAVARGVDFKEVKSLAKAAVKERKAAAKERKAAAKAKKAGKKPAEKEEPVAVPEPEEKPIDEHPQIDLIKEKYGSEETMPEAGTIRMMGAFQVNEHNVVLNPEEVELVNVKGCVAIARLALIDNVWYSAHELKTKSSGSSGPVIYRPEENWGHDLRIEALAWEADNARAFFEHEERGGTDVPPAVYTSLKLLIDAPLQVPVEETDPTMQLQEDVRLVVAHFGKISGTVSIDAVKIQQQLGWEMDRAVGIVNELRGRKILVMGCLDRESVQVQQILAAAKDFPEDVPVAVNANLPGSGKSKLAAAAKVAK